MTERIAARRVRRAKTPPRFARRGFPRQGIASLFGWWLFAASLTACVAGFGAGRLDGAEPISFADDVQPILAAKCVACHGPEKQEGGLRLDSLAAARRGGEQGPALVPGDVERSLLARAVTFRDRDLQMPPKQKLSDREIATLLDWVRTGGAWPEPVVALFEDDPQFVAALSNGAGRARLATDDVRSGRAALAVTPLQRESARIPYWNFPIREKPGPGEYRYLRLAWKKRGGGGVMLELATSGKWPDAAAAAGRYVAGPNTTGWAAKSVAESAPTEWTVVTFDLARDLGEVTLTGCAPTCDRGDEALFDMLLLGPSLESLDAYRPGGPLVRVPGRVDGPTDVGDAFSDARNPVRRAFGGERLDLWSLRPPRSSGRSLDELVRARLAADGRELAPAADARTLHRRLSFGLVGLPPTPEELERFEREYAADAEAAWARLVDRLLASPAYGERQARHWLDVVRYADTNGYERDEFRPLIYRYRDYVVRAFRQDKPFDQFIREQLAGDELKLRGAKEPDDELLVATGFLRLGQWDSTAAIFQEEKRLRAEQLADLTNTTSAAFLGLTFSCCQCHDHKYDPFTQADHFRLRAFFAALDEPNDTVVSSPEELAEIRRHNEALEAEATPLRTARAMLLDAARKPLVERRRGELSEAERARADADPEKLDAEAKKARDAVLAKLQVSDDEARGALDGPAKAREAELAAMIAGLEGRRREPRRAMTARDSGGTAPATHVLAQGDFASPREEVEPGFPSLFGPGPASPAPPSGATTGRRLALADWIASPANPWTARVIVNRVWQQHFGTGLVATPNDFGYAGARPAHPELLDKLAADFAARGWSLKDLHRAIVTSATYRQTSRVAAGETPHRFQPVVRRLDAETLRDALLATSGLLRPYDGGRPLWPPVPDELLKAQPAILEAEKGGDGGRMQGWYADPAEETDVRSLYLVRKRCLPIPFLQAFDLPDSTVSCARRDTTVVAPQALMMLNSPESSRYARAFAERATNDGRPLDLDDAERTRACIDAIFRRALGRVATDDERRLAVEFLRRHGREPAKGESPDDAVRRALVDLCRAVLNLNEFAYVD